MIIVADDRKYEVNVINVSMGGALITLDPGSHNKETFFVGRGLKDIVLQREGDGARARIEVKKAEIIRIEKVEETGRFCYALRFLQMDKDMTEQLHVFIYLSQRAILKRWNSISGA
jgi:c-di-GMP-binding flagellar brake protein YcgR